MKIRTRKIQRVYLSRYSVTERKIERFLCEGRGQGEGQYYIPWLKVFDVPSRGLSTRITGWKSGRLHHFFSRLEFYFFLILEWSPNVVDIREQFPLWSWEDTLLIAKSLGVKHPMDNRTKHPVVMTSDFVITLKTPTGYKTIVRSVKYAKDVTKRVLEKFEIEEILWDGRGVSDCRMITNLQIPVAMAKNIEWCYGDFRREFLRLTDEQLEESVRLLTLKAAEEKVALRHLAQATDAALKLKPGSSLHTIKHLIASHYWDIDMTQKINPNHILQVRNAEQLIS
jgi:hypothetical protein